MRNIIRIGILIIGIVLLVNGIRHLDDFIIALLKELDRMSFGDAVYLTSKDPSFFKLFISFIGLFLKLIVGFVLLIKPNILNRFYIPSTHNTITENNLHLFLTWSFIYCFGIYLLIDGIILLINGLIRYFIYASEARDIPYFKNFFLTIIPHVFKIIIGFILYKYFSNKIYSKELSNKSEI